MLSLVICAVSALAAVVQISVSELSRAVIRIYEVSLTDLVVGYHSILVLKPFYEQLECIKTK